MVIATAALEQRLLTQRAMAILTVPVVLCTLAAPLPFAFLADQATRPPEDKEGDTP